MKTEQDRSHLLYRFFNTEGDLLYVGITSDPPRRFTEHAAVKSWWDEVASIAMEKCDSRADLKRREFDAIRSESPRYNTVLKMTPEGECQETVEGAALQLQEAREALALALENARVTALFELSNGATEVDVAKWLGVDRMTVRKWRGKR